MMNITLICKLRFLAPFTSIVMLTSCSKDNVDPDAVEAVEEVQTAADEAIQKAEDALDEIGEIAPNPSSAEVNVTEALKEEAEAAAATLEARADEAASELREAIREMPNAQKANELGVENTPVPE
ncbi:MAG: hypothetical protein P1U58_01320 [Verrucomicrobiales bacterium]|nr:hypothetical protein [Verrucomicrobiales bacterium]